MMNETINVRIELPIDDITEDALIIESQHLRALDFEIQRTLEISSQLETTRSSENTQSGDIVTAIALFNLSLTALGLIWSIISVRRRGGVTIEKTLNDGTIVTLTKKDLTDIEFEEYEKGLERDIKSEKLQNLIIRFGA